MDDIAKMVSQRTGLSQDQSLKATQVVMDILMNRLPTPIANQVRDTMMGNGKGTSDMGNIARDMGSSMGQR